MKLKIKKILKFVEMPNKFHSIWIFKNKTNVICVLFYFLDSLIKELQLRRKHNKHSKDYKFVLFINLVKVSKLVKSSKAIFFRKKYQTPEKK